MPDPASLAEHRDRLVAHQTALGLCATTITAHRRVVTDLMGFIASRGCQRAADLRPDDVDAFVLHLRERGLAPGSVNAAASSLRIFGTWLYRRGLVLSDPTLALDDMAEGEPLRAPPLSEAQVAALLDALPLRSVLDLRNRAHLELLYGCGLRISESLDATLDDLDRARRTLLVHGKGGHERLLPILPSAMAALEDYLALRRSLLRGPDRGILFLSSTTGGRLSATTFSGWLARWAQHSIGRHVHPHALRHAAAVHLLRGGADIRHVQEFLGHADLDTTKTYLHLIPGHLRADYDKAMPALAGALLGVSI